MDWPIAAQMPSRQTSCPLPPFLVLNLYGELLFLQLLDLMLIYYLDKFNMYILFLRKNHIASLTWFCKSCYIWIKMFLFIFTTKWCSCYCCSYCGCVQWCVRMVNIIEKFRYYWNCKGQSIINSVSFAKQNTEIY